MSDISWRSIGVVSMRIQTFEWDDGNCLHIELGHGVAPYEAEQVFARSPLFRRTKRGHYAVFGPTATGRHLVVIFEVKAKGVARVITGWDMLESITLKLDPIQVQAIKKLATMKSMPYQTLIRTWLAEGLKEELHLAIA